MVKLHFHKRLLIIISLLVLATTVSSQENTPPPPAVDESLIPVDIGGETQSGEAADIPQTSSSFSFANSLRIFGALAFVIVLIVLFIKFLRKITYRNVEENGLIRLLDTRILHNDSMAHLVEVEGQIYLIGSGSGGIRLLAKITDKEAQDQILLKATTEPSAPVFSGLIPNAGGGASPTALITHFFKGQKDRLKKLRK